MTETIEEEAAKGESSVMRRERTELLAEVLSTFEEPADCAALLYAPIEEKLTYRRTVCYRFGYEGSETKLEGFIEDTLLDPVSQDLVLGGKPALDDYLFYLDYGMKKGMLDLEKETILRYYRELEETDYEIHDLQLSTRIYVFGAPGGKLMKDRFVSDVVNPAIHRWDLHDD